MSDGLLGPRRTVVFAGDSITDCGRRADPAGLGDGYVRNLYDDLAASRPRIVNVGISGNRAVDLVERWKQDVLTHQPDLVSVLVGINDTWRRYDKDDPTSTGDFEASYRELLEPLTAKLVLVEPFLVAVKPEQRGWRDDLDPKIEVVRRLAAEYDALLVPADVEFNRQALTVGATTLAYDGVHPTAAGHRLLADLWRRTVS
ncbi:lysophospholipase L1-like esterase [Kribbella voronezhensis]|uniref:Lysophospholipase L1-like esterase n=1 Tax=Kribbella voronezhensis TaxID=2512212 RepID=A0A4R7TGA5_9ACTN|nr:SGNH/GDSL hydrolase family protein [Kribbella voronezhensis]TDU90477.1 lysophospholipase L1-like esterase [Kribbella voronezhensis]